MLDGVESDLVANPPTSNKVDGGDEKLQNCQGLEELYAVNVKLVEADSHKCSHCDEYAFSMPEVLGIGTSTECRTRYGAQRQISHQQGVDCSH